MQVTQVAPAAPRSGTDALARRARRARGCWIVLAALIVVALVVSVMLGQYSLSPTQIGQLLAAGPSTDSAPAAILWGVRLPRIALAVCVGAGLAVAGTLMQALFTNPLAEPGVIGVSSGAAVGAALAIVTGVSHLSTLTVPAAAFLTGIATTLLVYRLARSRGQARAVALVLTGVAVNAVAGAIISAAVYAAPTTARDQIVFWQMGSLNAATWSQVAAVAPVCLIGLVAAVGLAPRLDVLALGERSARQVGLNTGRLRLVVVVVTALLTAAAVAFAGIITFVGLIVPHVLRLIVGPRNRTLVPLAAVGGALLVSVADLAARTLIPFSDLPIGIFTALVGGPTFFVLLRRALARGGQL